MSTPAKINFKLYQGSTFSEVLRWESSEKVYAYISNITNSAPVVITASAHNVPVDWRVKFSNILGMTELNSTDTYYQATAVTDDTITINSINSIGYKPYLGNGIVEYNKPIDLTGYTARMQIRAKLEDTVVIQELTTQNGLILLDNTKKTITLQIPAATTQNYTFSTAVYGLELVSSEGIVIQLITGSITLVKEVIR